MKPTLLVVIILAYLLSACVRSIPLNLDGLVNEKFEVLHLAPAFELYDLRIDIIRQTEETQNADGTCSTEDVPYHPLGFDLGNGLFYDWNENLSIRIDHLLDLKERDSYTLKTIWNMDKQKGEFLRISGEDYCWGGVAKGQLKQPYCGKQKQMGDRTMIFGRNKFHYAIETIDSALVYIPKLHKRKADLQIVETEDGSYRIGEGRREERYRQEQGEIDLDQEYIIRRLEGGHVIEIYSVRHRKRGIEEYLQYSIEKSNDRLFIYEPGNYGRIIAYEKNQLLFLENETVYRSYTVMD